MVTLIAFTSYYLSAYARQPARGPTMLAHLVAICWPMLASCWPMWSEKIRKMGTAKQRCKTQDILMVGGLSWGYVGLSWGQCGPILGLCWLIYVGPSWGLCWPMLGLCWPILRPMLAHVDPSWATSSEKWEKMGRAQNTVKRGTFWRGERSAAGAAAPLSYGEERTAVRQGHGQGAPGRIIYYIYIYIYIYILKTKTSENYHLWAAF